MKALAIDSVSACISIKAVNEKLTAKFSINIGLHQSEAILPAIERVLAEVNLPISELEFIALCQGPGSFTGLRLGFAAAKACGSENNDAFRMGEDGSVKKVTNHSGGVLGGISDGSELVFRVAFKPTPSIAKMQETVSRSGEDTDLVIHGRHDPVVVPRAVVVVEAMAAATLMDALLLSMTSRMDYVKDFFSTKR